MIEIATRENILLHLRFNSGGGFGGPPATHQWKALTFRNHKPAAIATINIVHRSQLGAAIFISPPISEKPNTIFISISFCWKA